MFGLSAQLRRAAASVATNLAEGCGRTQAEFARFVQISFGSACEVEYELLLAKDLGFVSTNDYEPLNRRVGESKTHVEFFDVSVAGRYGWFQAREVCQRKAIRCNVLADS